MKKTLLRLTFIMVVVLLTAGCLSAKPYLIEYSWGIGSRPDSIVKNIDFIESLPFDGLMINDYAGRHLLNPDFKIGSREATKGVWTYEQCISSFAPLTKSTFKKYTHNFAKVGMRDNEGLFSDWTWMIESFKNYARACKDLGIRGIVIDNEINIDPNDYWNYRGNPYYKKPTIGHPNGFSLKECHMQARLRGKQVMQAILSTYPEAHVLIFHGPYRSSAASNPGRDRTKWHCNGSYCIDGHMDGSFAAGIIDGSGPKSLAIDGGELYDFRKIEEFQDSYKWRKYGIAEASVNPPVLFMDYYLRQAWSKKCSISFGIYSSERDDITKSNWKTITDMSVVRNTTANALKVADDYVWHYTERYDWFNNPDALLDQTQTSYRPPIPVEWIEAIRLARKDAKI